MTKFKHNVGLITFSSNISIIGSQTSAVNNSDIGTALPKPQPEPEQPEPEQEQQEQQQQEEEQEQEKLFDEILASAEISPSPDGGDNASGQAAAPLPGSTYASR